MIEGNKELDRVFLLPKLATARGSYIGVLLGTVLIVAGWILLASRLVVGRSNSNDAPFLETVNFGESLLVTGLAFVVIAILANVMRSFQCLSDRLTSKVMVPRSETAPQSPMIAPKASLLVVGRGQVDERGFLVLSDGSVILETFLGQRRFLTLADAQEFIGSSAFRLTDTVQIPLRAKGRIEPHPATRAIPLANSSRLLETAFG